MEIEVGEYVRTKNGEIFKVADEGITFDTVAKDKTGLNYELIKNIVKHSKNIIDLVEVWRYFKNKR